MQGWQVLKTRVADFGQHRGRCVPFPKAAKGDWITVRSTGGPTCWTFGRTTGCFAGDEGVGDIKSIIVRWAPAATLYVVASLIVLYRRKEEPTRTAGRRRWLALNGVAAAVILLSLILAFAQWLFSPRT
jgi:hypothetical protein